MNCTEGIDCPRRPPRMPLPVFLPDYLHILFLSVISLFSLFGNTIAILCFLQFRKKVKQNTVAYLISLAVSDLWIGFMTGMGVVTVSYRRWIFGSVMCQMLGFINNTTLVNSLWTVALGSIDRCFAICLPFTHRSIMTKVVVLSSIGLVWVYSAALSIPPLTGQAKSVYMSSPTHAWCAVTSRGGVYFVIYLIGFLPVPMVIIVTSYITRQLERIQLSRDFRMSISVNADNEVDNEVKSVVLTPKSEQKLSCKSSDTLRQQNWLPSNSSPQPSNNQSFSFSFKLMTLIQRVFGCTPKPVQAQNASKMTASFVFQSSPVPATKITRCYSNPGNHSNSNNALLPPSTQTSSSISQKSEEEIAAKKLKKQAATLLFVISTTISFCYCPIFIVAGIAFINRSLVVEVPVYLIQAFTLLMVANASINPLIYFLLNKEFRLSAKALFAGSLKPKILNTFKRSTPPNVSLDQSQRQRTHTASYHTLQSLTSDHQPMQYDPLQKDVPRDHQVLSREQSQVTNHNSAPTSPAKHLRALAEERITQEVLRRSVVVMKGEEEQGNPKSAKKPPPLQKRPSGLINLSFYEVESSI